MVIDVSKTVTRDVNYFFCFASLKGFTVKNILVLCHQKSYNRDVLDVLEENNGEKWDFPSPTRLFVIMNVLNLLAKDVHREEMS